MRILVTRPPPAGNTLCDIIRASGHEAIFFPTIAFAPPTQQLVWPPADQFDWLIFISPAAVRAVPFNWIQSCDVAAVGKGTAAALVACGVTEVLYPAESPSAASLLALAPLQHVADQRIAIIKGEGGRALLADTLRVRGAIVTELLAYRRVLPDMAFPSQRIDAIIATSATGIENLLFIHPASRDVPLIVISPRLAKAARALGCKRVLLATDASHDAIMAVLKCYIY
jgi:uroporphyrinogen-III synthase